MHETEVAGIPLEIFCVFDKPFPELEFANLIFESNKFAL